MIDISHGSEQENKEDLQDFKTSLSNSHSQVKLGTNDLPKTNLTVKKEENDSTSTAETEDEEFKIEKEFGAYEQCSQPRQSHVETIVESDEEIDYSFAAGPMDDKEGKRDDLVYRFGVTQVLAPKKRVIKTSEGKTEISFQHELVDVGCLVDKIIIFYVAAKVLPLEFCKGKELKEIMKDFALQTSNFTEFPDLERVQGSGDFVVVYVSRDESREDFEAFIKDQPFYAIPFDCASTRNTLAELLRVDGAVFSQRRQKIIVYSLDHKLITNMGKAAMFYNRENCITEWKNSRPGISFRSMLYRKLFS